MERAVSWWLAGLVCLACVAAALALEQPPFREPVKFTERGSFSVYPSQEDRSLFLSPLLNFEALTNRIVIGGADGLFILHRNLSLSSVMTWRSDQQHSNSCISRNNNNAQSPECKNHITVYETVPGFEDALLLVCGTQATIEPQCRTLAVSAGMVGAWSAVNPASPGFLSPYPNLPSLGEFRRRSGGTPLDMNYFSVGFRETSSGLFDLGFQTVTLEQPDSPLPSAVTTQRLYGLKSGDTQWLEGPSTFVDYFRADYTSNVVSEPENYQFYFVFLREELVSASEAQNLVISRVLRLCRNDPGVLVNATSGGGTETVFSSFVKARIFCEREVPPGVIGALDFQYDEIRSVGFNSPVGGRYSENGDWKRFMYGAFSGAEVGPVGTAICLYEAENSGSFGGGIFDIFREDLQRPDGEGGAQNDFLECLPSGRDSAEADRVTVARDVRQEGEDPVLVFNGYLVTQIVVDSVCVVRSTDPAHCRDQDVLWLGTSIGTVMKVVTTSDRTPLVVEDIHLLDDRAVDLQVNDLRLEEVGGVTYVFASTQQRVYRLALEKCSTYDFDGCIGSQDPYCVWNSLDGRGCQLNPLRANEEAEIDVPPYLVQNIHTGQVDIPEVQFSAASYTVREGEPVTVTLTHDTVSRSFQVSLTTVDRSAVVGTDFTAPLQLQNFTSGSELAVAVPTLLNPAYKEDNNFILRVASDGATPIKVLNPAATVRIIDRDGARFQLGLVNVGNCNNWIPPGSEAGYLSDVSKAIAAAIDKGCEKCQPYNENFIQNPSFTCTDDEPKLVVYRASFLVKSAETTTRFQIADVLKSWVDETPVITILRPEGNLELNTVRDCPLIIDETPTDLCSYDDNTQGLTRDSGSAVGGLIAGVVILALIAAVLTVLLVLMLVFVYNRVLKSKNMPVTSSITPLMSQTSRTENGNKIVCDSETNQNAEVVDATNSDKTDPPVRYGTPNRLSVYSDPEAAVPATVDAVEYEVQLEVARYTGFDAKFNLSADLDPPNSYV